ncbi:hypothetical protein RD110_08000 [Rhodoferax koreense]|uniref:Helix-turn-helix domain-containing protein n=2 Tax=Rhodoferax koreensis TaxID=1842727 RepID=A0A1P8JTP9_9BURK|nr:hypothetical protein RD110_08000 [Rhodoferax koreense]
MECCWPLRMPPTAKAVLISMADQANDAGLCWPSIDTISERTCVSRRAVIDALKWLESSHALSADRSNGRHTKYMLTPDLFSPSSEKSPRTMKRLTSADAALPPVQMPHRSNTETSADAAQVGVQMPHGLNEGTSADAALTGADAAPPPVQMPHKPVRQPHTNHQEPSVEPSRTTNARASDSEIDAGAFVLAGFLEFWKAYPRKVSRPAAHKAWFKVWKTREPDRAVIDLMLDAIAWQRKTEDWRKEGGRFIPHPATWLNNERWNDEPPATAKKPAEGPSWFELAGFTHIAEAQNAHCHVLNFHQFRDGKRLPAEVSA